MGGGSRSHPRSERFAMSVSTIVVAVNAMLLRSIDLRPADLSA
jgi:hypothetical protein